MMKNFLLMMLVIGFAACNDSAKLKKDTDTLVDDVKHTEVMDSIKAKGGRILDSVKSKGGNLLDKANEKLKHLKIKDSIQ